MAMAPVSVANDGLRVPHTNPSHRIPSQISWVQCERTERIRRSRETATETSWVPLQESTAETLGFFRLYTSSLPEGTGHWRFLTLKACFQSDRNDDGQSGSAATGPDHIHTKISQGSPKRFSWVQCERTERIRRSSIAATETSCVPLPT